MRATKTDLPPITEAEFQRHHICLRCGKQLIPSGRNNRYRPTQRFCSPKCARAMQVIVPKPASERLWKRVSKLGPIPLHRPELGRCWIWTGSQSSNGYGNMYCGNGKYISTHVVSYEAAKGPVPDGFVLDHLCRTPLCLNPDHLEPVTNRINIMRGVSPTVLLHLKGMCKNGHSAATEACRVRTKDGSYRVAYCRACRREKRAAENNGSRIS